MSTTQAATECGHAITATGFGRLSYSLHLQLQIEKQDRMTQESFYR